MLNKQTIWNFGGLSLVALLFCFSLLFGSSVKASSIATVLLPSGGYYTIPEEEMLFVCAVPHQYTDYTLTIGGVDMTLLKRWRNDDVGMDIFYKTDLAAQAYLIGGTGAGGARCFVVSEVDLEDPFITNEVATSDNHAGSNWTSTYANGLEDNLLLNFVAHKAYNKYYDGELSDSTSDKNIIANHWAMSYRWGIIGSMISSGSGTDTINYYGSYGNTYWPGSTYWVEINHKVSAPATDVTIEEAQYNPVTGNVFLSGTCVQSGSGVNQMSLYAVPVDVSTSTMSVLDKVYPERGSLVSCQSGTWSALFNGTGLIGSNRLVIDNYFYGENASSFLVNWQTVTGFLRFDYGPSHIVNIDTTPSTGATTTLNFIYNICDDPDYSATTSKIWLVNQTGTSFQNTSFGEGDFYLASTCSGTGSITFHLYHGQTGSVRAYYVYANSWGTQILKSGYFYVYATASSGTALEDRVSTGSTTDFDIVGLAVTTGSDFLKGLFKPIIFSLRQFFPFNIPVIIYNSWFSSADQAIPSNLTVFAPLGANGDLTIDLPHAGNVVVFGPSVLLTDSHASAWYSGVRDFSTVLLWFLFACLVIFVGYRIFNIMSGRQDSTFDSMPKMFAEKFGRPSSVSVSVRSKRGKGRVTYHRNSPL